MLYQTGLWNVPSRTLKSTPRSLHKSPSSTARSSAGGSNACREWTTGAFSPHANENGPQHGGVTYRAISGLNRWLLYVNVASIDGTVTLVQELGGSIVRTTASNSI
jgi:hypothetical protein